MTPGLIKAIVAMAGSIILLLIVGLVFSLFILLTELNDPNPNAALTALLGSITSGLTGALLTITSAMAAIIGAIAFTWRKEGRE